MALHSAVFIFLCIVASNSKHTYTFQADTSISLYSGTEDTIYFRLCNIANECGMFRRVDSGWPNSGTLYNYSYITNQNLGPITKAQIVLEGSDQLCLSYITVDEIEYDPGILTHVCIEDTAGGCDTITVNLQDNTWNTTQTTP